MEATDAGTNDRTASLQSMAAVLPVTSVESASAHYRQLGFSTQAFDAAYGYAERSGVSLHLAQMEGLDPLTNTSAVYLFVDDADALHAEWTSSGAHGRFHPPTTTDYGLREAAHVDPDGNLLRYGSPIG